MVNMDKYNSLNKFQKEISQFIKRYYKEIGGKNYEEIFKLINNLKIEDDIISDIIDLICDIGDISTDFLIYEINRYNGFLHKIYRVNDKCIKSKKELCDYVKIKMSNTSLLTDPLGSLFLLSFSVKGSYFYQEVRKKLNKKLFLYQYLYGKTYFCFK